VAILNKYEDSKKLVAIMAAAPSKYRDEITWLRVENQPLKSSEQRCSTFGIKQENTMETDNEERNTPCVPEKMIPTVDIHQNKERSDETPIRTTERVTSVARKVT